MKKKIFKIEAWLKVVLILLLASAILSGCKNKNGVNQNPDIQLRFAVASDGHYGQQDTDYKGNYDSLIIRLNQELVEKGLDFVVLNGDIFHNDPTYLPEVKKVLERLNMPFYAVRGNHDRATDIDWKNVWGTSDNYDFEMGNYAMVLASTSDTSGKYLCAEANWFWDRLEYYQSKKGVFVFMHITPKKWTENGVDCPEILNSLESHPNVMAIFQGHDHDEDAMKVSNGIPFYFDGHFGGSWGTGYRGYRIVEVLENGSIRTYEYNMDDNSIVNEHLQHLAFLKKGKLKFPPSEDTHSDEYALTDGVFGTTDRMDGNWTSFKGTNFEWTLNFGQITTLHEISAGFLVDMAAGIFQPDSIEFLVSLDGSHFSRVYSMTTKKPDEMLPLSIHRYHSTLKEVPCRVLCVRAVPRKEFPGNSSERREESLLFVDEIVVN